MGAVIIVRLSLARSSRSEVKALGRGHGWFQFFNQRNLIKLLAFDTNNRLLFLARNENSPLGISFIAVALDFQVLLAQTIRLTKSNSKESKRFRCCCSSTKRRNHLKVEMTGSANEEQVFLLLDQSRLNSFALGERKIKKECPNFSFYVIKFQNSRYFSFGVSADDSHRKSLQSIFSETNGNIKEAPHTFLAYYLVINKV